MALADLLNTINDASDRAAFDAILEKHGTVKSALEWGDRAVPIIEKVRTIQGAGDPAQELSRLADWVTWRINNTDDSGKIKLVGELEGQRAELQRRVTQLEAERGTEMTGEEVKTLATQLFEERMTALRTDPNNPLIDRTGLVAGMTSQAQRFQEIYSVLTPEIVYHAQKYGEPFPAKEVLDYIEKHGERDPKKAYEAVCAPRDTQLQIKHLEADAAKKFEEGKAAGVAEAQARANGQRMPVDGGGGQGGRVNHFMNRIFKSRESRAVQNTRLGSGSAAQEGYAAYQKKQMGAGSV